MYFKIYPSREIGKNRKKSFQLMELCGQCSDDKDKEYGNKKEQEESIFALECTGIMFAAYRLRGKI